MNQTILAENILREYWYTNKEDAKEAQKLILDAKTPQELKRVKFGLDLEDWEVHMLRTMKFPDTNAPDYVEHFV